MIKMTENYRDFNKSLLIYNEAETSKAEIMEGFEESKDTAVDNYDPKKADEAWNTIEKNHGKSKYQETISNYVDGIIDGNEEFKIKDLLIKESTSRYGLTYGHIKVNFNISTGTAKSDYESAYEDILDKTKSELNALKNAIKNNLENKEDYKEKSEDLESKTNISEWNAKRILSKLIDHKHETYCNLEWQKLNLNKKNAKKYKSLSGKLQDGMTMFAKDKLSNLSERKELNSENIKLLEAKIEEKYKTISNIDNKSGMISLSDLNNQDMDVINSEEGSDGILEISYLSNYEEWKSQCSTMAKSMVEMISDKNLEGKFIETAKKHALENKETMKIDDYREAKMYFDITMDRKTFDGPKEYHKFMKYFNEGINEGRILNENIEPAGLGQLVQREYNFLRNGTTIAENDSDRLVIKFSTANNEERKQILQTQKNKLFKGIKNIQEHYGEYFTEKGTNIEEGSVRYSKNPSKPSGHDKIARSKALIWIANDAEWMVNNHGEKIDVKVDESYAKGLNFDYNLAQTDTRYRSSITRNGFNARDFAIGGVKALASITVLMNILNSISEGKNWEERIEKIISNPFIIGGAGVAYGAHTLQKHPEYQNFIGASEKGRFKMKTIRALREIDGKTKKFGKNQEDIKSFVGSDEEFNAINKLSKDDIKSLIEKANENKKEKKGRYKGKYAEISQEMIKETLKDKAPKIGLKNNHTRFLFYKKLLSGGDEKPNNTQLKNVCYKFYKPK